MKKEFFMNKYLNLKVLSLCSFLATLFVACSQPPQQTKMPPMPVTVMSAKAVDIPLSFSYPANLTSDKDVIIKAKVSGQIVQQFFKAGDKVKKDQILFKIEPDKYQAAFDIAKASVLVAEANLENARKEHSRNQVLIQKQAISQRDYDTSLANYNSAKANLESAKAQLQNARLDLDYTSIRAPFEGILGDALINVGDYVNASSTNLVRLTNLNPIYADFFISDVEKLRFNRNLADGNWEINNADVSINVNNEAIQGRLYFVDSVIDEKSGSVKARAVFDNNDTKLLPGIFTTITSSGFVQKNGFQVPQTAILQDTRSAYVYTVVNGKIAKTNVNIAYQTNDFAVIDKGLKEGDKIVLDNFKKIRPGSDVQEVGSK